MVALQGMRATPKLQTVLQQAATCAADAYGTAPQTCGCMQLSCAKTLIPRQAQTIVFCTLCAAMPLLAQANDTANNLCSSAKQPQEEGHSNNTNKHTIQHEDKPYACKPHLQSIVREYRRHTPLLRHSRADQLLVRAAHSQTPSSLPQPFWTPLLLHACAVPSHAAKNTTVVVAAAAAANPCTPLLQSLP
jgi:hypothetical protein